MDLKNKSSIKVVLVDREDKIVGYKEKNEAHHHPVSLHRAVSAVVYNEDHDKILLQKRSRGKKTWPGYWSNTSCTHPFADESYKKAAERRLFEEMGVKTQLEESYRFIYKAIYDKDWGEHEYDVVFIGEYQGDIIADPAEVDEYKWMKVADLVSDMKINPDIYTPWFKMIIFRLH